VLVSGAQRLGVGVVDKCDGEKKAVPTCAVSGQTRDMGGGKATVAASGDIERK